MYYIYGFGLLFSKLAVPLEQRMVTNAALQKMLPTLQSTQPEGLLTKKFEMEYIVWKKPNSLETFSSLILSFRDYS